MCLWHTQPNNCIPIVIAIYSVCYHINIFYCIIVKFLEPFRNVTEKNILVHKSLFRIDSGFLIDSERNKNISNQSSCAESLIQVLLYYSNYKGKRVN